MVMHKAPSGILRALFWWSATGLVVLAAGCGSGTTRTTAAQLRAFDNAPAAVKQIWDKALAAERAKDYAAAQNSFESLSKMELTSQQKQALDAERFAFQQRLYQAAEKGDPAAVKTVQEINAHYRR
ncbi:MAG: hypothetical protein KGJ60_01960 [Verrucomicrobiota bacterium]|nr:hypothetical protein [Verrucomicrobiota bacterium]